MSKICIIDYKGGNIFSVQNTLNKLGAESYLSSNPAEIEQAERIIFPGVGSFATAMDSINKYNLADCIKSKALSGIPFLGICVGMQVMFDTGSEASNGTEANTPGLGIFKGRVDKFESNELKIPHMGWNTVSTNSSRNLNSNPLFDGINHDNHFYFVHSYKVNADALLPNLKKFPHAEIMSTNYATEFISSIWDAKKLFACQFHPEKSARNGLKLLQNFLDIK